MRRLAVGILLALLCAPGLGCKDGSGSTGDAGMDASFDGGAGGSAGTGGAAGNGGVGGAGGIAGAGGVMCEFTMCPTGCVDLDTNDQNCGSCANICDETDVCNGGICVPG